MIMTHGIIQQAPTVEYKILQNFIDGHSIGEKVTASYIPDWITTVISDEDCIDNWMNPWTDSPAYQYLVNNTVGANLIDSRKPIDFTKYGVSSGTPFGNLTCNDDNYLGIAFNTNMEVTHPFTLEVWTAFRTDYGYDSQDWLPILIYGSDTDRNSDYSKCLTLYYKRFYDGSSYKNYVNLYLNYNPMDRDGGQYELASVLIDDVTSWHHYAISMNSSTLFLFVDGVLAFSKSLSDNITIDDTQITKTLGEFISEFSYQRIAVNGGNMNNTGYMVDANWAQLALCDTCKWTDDFIVPTEAY